MLDIEQEAGKDIKGEGDAEVQVEGDAEVRVEGEAEVRVEGEGNEEPKNFSYQSIFIICFVSLVSIAAMLFFQFHKADQFFINSENESSNKAPVIIKNDFLVLSQRTSVDHTPFYDIKVLKIGFPCLSELISEESLPEMFNLNNENTFDMKVSPDGNIGSLHGYDFSSKKYRFEFINKSNSKKSIYELGNSRIYDKKSKNYCFLPDSKGIVFMSEFGFTKIEFDDNFEQLVNFKKINIDDIDLDDSDFFVSEEGILYFLGLYGHKYLYKKQDGTEPIPVFEIPFISTLVNLNNYKNMLVISNKQEYFFISDLSNPNPKCIKVSIKGIRLIHNVAFSKYNEYLYLIVKKTSYKSNMNSIIRIKIDYENLKDNEDNVISEYEDIIKGNYCEHYLAVL